MITTEPQVVCLSAAFADELAEKIEEQLLRKDVVGCDPFAPWHDGAWHNVILVLTIDMQEAQNERVRSWR